MVSCVAAPIDVYICAGQSNMDGGFYTELEPSLLGVQNSRYNYLIRATNTVESPDWIDMQPRNGRYYGADLSFAQAMEQRTGNPIAVIKVCAGGTGLWQDWLPSVNDLYPWMMTKVNSALGQLVADDFQPNLAGFLWVQGENDAGYTQHSAEYDDNLATFAAAVRADLNEPQLPFVINQLHASANRPAVTKQALRESQLAAAAADPFMEIVNIDDLALKTTDNLHFTGPTHVELGRRFADLFAPSGDFADDGDVDANDLAAWKLAYGSSRVGDGNADGVSDGADFLLWQRQVQAGNPDATAVPEPSAFALAGIVLLAFFSRRQAA